MKIQIINPTESIDNTNEFIDQNRNWSVEKQEYKLSEKFLNFQKLTDCDLYQRGEYIILQYKNTVLYWEKANTYYPYFQEAIAYLELEKPRKWKTAGRLIALRQAIRETSANLAFPYDLLHNENGSKKTMTLNRYEMLMEYARTIDLEHHGYNTF